MLAPSIPTDLDHAQLRAVEIVWNSYVLQLCVVNHFARACYVCHYSAWLVHMSADLTNFRIGALLSAKISKLFSPTQSPYNENITGRDPNQTVEILMLWQGACYLLMCNYEQN